ncbi:MAG TPA: hypothetical protein GXX49_07875 [Clostridiaceae bacterium]|nr:hypothetical protein [Clostridiaceae bacterium]
MNKIDTLAACCCRMLKLLLNLYEKKEIDLQELKANSMKKVKFLLDNFESLVNNEKEIAEDLIDKYMLLIGNEELFEENKLLTGTEIV